MTEVKLSQEVALSSKRRVTIVTPVFPPYRGGIGNVAYHHARLLAERGQEVTVFSPDYSYPGSSRPSPQPSPEGRGGFATELLKPFLKYGNAAWVPSLAEKLKDFKVVILEYPFFGGMKAVLEAKKKYGFKLIVYYHMDVVATLRQGFGWSSSLKGLIFEYTTRWFLPRLIKAADLVLASSEDYAYHSNLGKYWQDTSKFQVLPLGVDLNRFTFSDAPRERLILFVGGLDKAHYFKGVEYLIRAVALIHDNNFKLIIAGQGELIEKYKKLSQDLGVADKVEFAGAVSDEELVKLYQRAVVTVLPSIDQSEAFGMVLAESLAGGTPVIASDLPGVRSVFENGVSGLTVVPRDSQALAERIKYVLDNPDKARAMGQAGRKLVAEKYDWKIIGDKLRSIID